MGALSARVFNPAPFVFAFVVIYTFHPVVEWLSQRRRLFCGAIAALLLFSYGYDLLSALYLERTSFLFHRSIGCGRGCCFI